MRYGYIIGAGVLTGLGIAGYAFYKGQIEQLKQTTFDVLSIKPVAASIDIITVDVGLRIHSVSKVEALVKDFYFEIYIDNKKVAVVTPVATYSPILIPAQGYADSTFQFSFSPRSLSINAISFISDYLKNKDLPVRIVGSARIQTSVLALPGIGSTIPVKLSTTVPVDIASSIKEFMS